MFSTTIISSVCVWFCHSSSLWALCSGHQRMSETEGHQKKPHPQLLLQVLKGSTKQINYTYVFSISKKILLKFKTKQWFTAGKCFLIHIKTPAKTDTRDIRECFIRDFFYDRRSNLCWKNSPHFLSKKNTSFYLCSTSEGAILTYMWDQKDSSGVLLEKGIGR